MDWDKFERMRYDYSKVVVKYMQHTCFPLKKNSLWHFIVILSLQTIIRQKLLQKQWTVINQ